jgi:two-component system KDP operon response regulator KdpE
VDCRHYLRLYVKYLRSKIEDDPKNPQMILSEWGVGYRFEPSAS